VCVSLSLSLSLFVCVYVCYCVCGGGCGHSFFFEKNIHSFFLRILNQKTNSTITVQLLQTLSILFENIQTETSICAWPPRLRALWLLRGGQTCSRLCVDGWVRASGPDYLLSNNYVNQIICHKFDFSDEEILAYYVSFLKTLSLKLNKSTIHFFYNEARARRATRPRLQGERHGA
jgi:protein CLEC16A